MNINPYNSSHDTNMQHETRTDSVDIPLPIKKDPKTYGTNIDSSPLKKRLIVLMDETTSTLPITTNL